MIELTKTEISWIISELDKRVLSITNDLNRYQKMNTIERGLLNLKSEQLNNISSKLQKALDENNKRIKIKQ